MAILKIESLAALNDITRTTSWVAPEQQVSKFRSNDDEYAAPNKMGGKLEVTMSSTRDMMMLFASSQSIMSWKHAKVIRSIEH